MKTDFSTEMFSDEYKAILDTSDGWATGSVLNRNSQSIQLRTLSREMK